MDNAQDAHGGSPRWPPSGARIAVCTLMVLAAAGLVAATFLGAPLVSILLVGLLLLCPLLMWVPFRSADGAVRRTTSEREGSHR